MQYQLNSIIQITGGASVSVGYLFLEILPKPTDNEIHIFPALQALNVTYFLPLEAFMDLRNPFQKIVGWLLSVFSES